MINIRYSTGIRLQGILMAMGDGLIRVAIKGADDAAIYRLIHGSWVSEDCEVVTIEFPKSGGSDKSEEIEAIFPLQAHAPAAQRIM